MCFSTTIVPHEPYEYQNSAQRNSDQFPSMDRGDLNRRVLKACRGPSRSPGIYTYNTMQAAGFEYINNGDAARCATCGLQISGWTSDMQPFVIHKQRSPTCPFVLSMLPSIEMITTSTSNIEEPSPKRLKTDASAVNFQLNKLVEVETLKQVRKRTFSHWPHRSSPSSSQMIEAGFFNCNVGDRVICIYCNLICQQWTPNTDDPCEVHKTLSPKCSYVIAILAPSQTSSTLIINEHSTSDLLPISTRGDQFFCNEFVQTTACNATYSELSKRTTSFATWPNESLPSVDELVKAGFFYTGTKNIVICFYCNGSLQNWGPNDNPTIEHARWFPHCAYAKQICGDELYRKIQESKRAQQEHARTNDSSNRFGTSSVSSSHGSLLIPDEITLSRLVAARLDLPISQSLLDRNFKLSIIKRCWEDQLRLTHEDSVSDCDLLMACTILQKQIEHINGKKENIIVPSVAMKNSRKKMQAEAHAHELATSASLLTNSANSNDVEVTASHTMETSTQTSVTTTETIIDLIPTSVEAFVQNHTDNAPNLDLCRLCLTEEWYPALVPCGHVPCNILHEH